jgi:eukaryotic-like serine/threonine-protein kinase
MHVVHRDVSPTNVIIGDSGQVKLIDFGIARQGTAIKDEAGMRPGKASYMSPEQAQGAALDGRSDLFSLGTILYEITVGRRLWRGSRANSIRRIVEEKPVPPTYVRHDYPGDLEMIVLRALEKKPEDRYQSAHEFAEALQYFLQDSGARMRSHHQLARYLHEIYSPEAEAQITEDGLRQARIFAEGDEDGRQEDVEALDFDQAPADGPGAALARALRATGSALDSRPAASDGVFPTADEVAGWDGVAPAATETGQVASAESRNLQSSADQAVDQDGASEVTRDSGQGMSVSSGAAQVPVSPADSVSGDAAPPASRSGATPRRTPAVARVSRTQKAVVKGDKVPRSVPLGAVLFIAVLLAALTAGLVWLLRGG